MPWAKSPVDMALWDIKGKVRLKNFYSTLRMRSKMLTIKIWLITGCKYDFVEN